MTPLLETRVSRCLRPPRFSLGRRALSGTVLKKLFLGATLVSLIILGYLVYRSNWLIHYNSFQYSIPRLKPYAACVTIQNDPLQNIFRNESTDNTEHTTKSELAEKDNFQHRGTVLIIPKTSYSSAFKSVSEILVANRIKYKSSVAGKNLPDLIKLSKGMGKYGVIVFEDLNSYLQMDRWNREILDKYCSTFNVGIVAFLQPATTEKTILYDHTRNIKLPLTISSEKRLRDITVEEGLPMLRITKGGRTLAEISDVKDWVTFHPDEKDEKEAIYRPVAWGLKTNFDKFGFNKDDDGKKMTVIEDTGKGDGIPKVLIGSGISKHWIHKLLFLDALSYLSQGRIKVSLTRYVQIDIDDIFVGKNRLSFYDVQALLESQKRIQRLVPGFKYNLGFSGGYFKSGSYEENLGDDELIKNRNHFWWFPHMYHHLQPHKFDNVSLLIDRMELNKQFSKDYEIPVENFYSVAPHHSGVYPVHEQLYEAWTKVWQIQVTSTEEYPHLRPARLRRGFVHRGIAVLPRQTCGLYTKNTHYDAYPNGGPKTLETSIRGGELFQTLVYNPVSIFMTHMPNYSSDRLAPYTFESLFGMIQCWTNLKLKAVKPLALSKIYFDLFPEERMAVWGDPCLDRRHRDIWSETKSCDRLPNFLIIGPQKTGTTALYSFLQMHPGVESNLPNPETFEELQFFSGANYIKGIDWYMENFPPRVNGTPILFEKSATYFDRDLVPSRAHRLLSDAQLIAIIISPAKRAYSWYQHQRAHGEPAALNYTFHEVITATGPSLPKPLRSLQSRCLEPGKYSSHLERWLSYYKSQQLHIVDGEELKYDPVSVMNRLQHFLNIKPFIDFTDKLKFDRKKGFFCKAEDVGNSPRCLGKGKGRQYPNMDTESQNFLRDYYRLHNEALLKLLRRLGYSIPDWLEDELKDSHSNN